MSAQNIDTFVVRISPNPQSPNTYDIEREPASPSTFTSEINENIRTLSTSNVDNAQSIEGLLYVPELPASDACRSASQHELPANATHDTDIPYNSFNIIALVPWLSQGCMKSYLDHVNNLTVALITYLPNNQSGIPPPVSDPQWFLNDGGRWKSDALFPVYAIPGDAGSTLAQQLAVYNGNLSNIQNGIFEPLSDPGDLIRLYTTIETNARSNLPSLWTFLLMVLGIVLFLVVITSFTMHYYQRRNRSHLRRRIERGEVDLEVLGIRRLTIPQALLDRLPVYIYTTTEGHPTNEAIPRGTQTPACKTTPERICSATDAVSSPPAILQAYQQPTCAICLDDFVANATAVKELPCKHIFHPECIDQLLNHHSSLCPICKATVLPRGYCPELSNAIVRRERQARRLPQQESAAQTQSAEAPTREALTRRYQVYNRMASFHRQFGRASRSGDERRISGAPASQSMEMSDRFATAATSQAPADQNPPAQASMDRTERARRRVSAMLGHQVMTDEEERERRNQLPKWRKAVGSVFPGWR